MPSPSRSSYLPHTPFKSHLCAARQRLVELMQEINFGRLENLVVRNGQPVLDAAVRVVRELKFASENSARPEVQIDDFALKARLVDLFEQFDRLGDFTALSLTIKHGLPFHMEVASPIPGSAA